MRNRFEQQLSLGVVPISEVRINTKSRDELPPLLKSLQELYCTPQYNERICDILSAKLIKRKKQTGRHGMGLWEIFVLAQVRLCLNTNYDTLHNLANCHSEMRGILGVFPSEYISGKEYEYQNILDNVSLLDDEMVKQINDVIVAFGHDTFKKKETEALQLKVDSFVVESTVHFPTDYNLLWDSGRKCIDCIKHFQKNYPELPGWRKRQDWLKELKGYMRAVGKASSGGGKNKDQRVAATVKQYLNKAGALSEKIHADKDNIPCKGVADFCQIVALNYYLEMLDKHIDLVDRRLLKGEQIPQSEKVFSIFETYTDWITKGKLHPNVELGKKLLVTTDQYNLIVDYQITENKADSCYLLILVERLMHRFNIDSMSVDKGFWNPIAFELLNQIIPELVMPKKGKLNQVEKAVQQQKRFKKIRNQHSAIESNINELEQRGLNRCPDKGWKNFKRYVGLSVCAYNLHKIGKEIIRIEKEKEAKEKAKEKTLSLVKKAA